MALQYGMNITASDMKVLLEKNDKQQSGIRTWRQLFGNASLGFNAQSDALTTDYSDAIAQAYRANFEQNNAIMNSGLSVGATKEMLSASRNDLHTAYESYVRNYGKDTSALAETYGEEVSAIDTALTERAQNFSKLYNSAYRYLQEELYNNLEYMASSGLDKYIYNDETSDNYGELMPWHEISATFMNADGSLTTAGMQFFDQIFNTPAGHDVRTYGKWLSDVSMDEKDDLYGLYDWYVGQDAFNYNFAGTNAGTANILTGRESTDQKYGDYDYLTAEGLSDLSASGVDFSNAKSTFDKIDDPIAPRKTGRARAGGKQKAVREKRRNEAAAAWSEYTSNASAAWNKLTDALEGKLGANNYGDFRAQNADVYEEFAKLSKDMLNGEYSDDYVRKYEELYRELYKRANAFIRDINTKSRRTSGF